jgi:hypothetical protein
MQVCDIKFGIYLSTAKAHQHKLLGTTGKPTTIRSVRNGAAQHAARTLHGTARHAARHADSM